MGRITRSMAIAALIWSSAGMSQINPQTGARQIECQLVDCSGNPADDDAEQSFSLVRNRLPNLSHSRANANAVPKQAKVAGRLDMRLAFASGSAELAPKMATQARMFAEALRGPFASQVHFRIEGHTDSMGSSAANRELSLRRAKAVVDFLAREGVSSARLEAVGYGDAKPRPGLSGGNPANRRVEIVRQD